MDTKKRFYRQTKLTAPHRVKLKSFVRESHEKYQLENYTNADILESKKCRLQITMPAFL